MLGIGKSGPYQMHPQDSMPSGKFKFLGVLDSATAEVLHHELELPVRCISDVDQG